MCTFCRHLNKTKGYCTISHRFVTVFFFPSERALCKILSYVNEMQNVHILIVESFLDIWYNVFKNQSIDR